MKIIFFGTPSFVIPVLEILAQRYEVVAVVTAMDKPVGRKQILTPSPVKEFGVKNTIEVLTPQQFSNQTIEQLTALKPDLIVTAAYGRIIPKAVLDIPQYGAINIHPSALPKYRGPSPITQTILNGDTTSAISFIQMDEKMDHGPIIKSVPFDIPEDATTESLTPAMFAKSAALLPEVIDDYVAGKLTPVEQNHTEATYTHIIKKEDGYIDLDNPPTPEELDRKIRAYYPWPTVWGKLRLETGELRIKFLPSYVCHPEQPQRHPEFSSGSHEIPDQVRNDNAFCIQMEGGKPMSIKDFLNGYPELKKAIEKLG